MSTRSIGTLSPQGEAGAGTALRALVTGVSGWAGHGTATGLLAAGHQVVGFSRDPSRVPLAVPVVRGDAVTGEGLDEAFEGVDVAYHFMHSFESGHPEGFAARDRQGAENFVHAARAAGVERLIYCGVILPDGELSPHLRSRLEAEEIVRSATPTSLSLRASIVISARAPTFRFIMRMVEATSLIVHSPASSELWQPIDGRDVASCMVAAATWAGAAGQAIDIAGPDVIRFVEISERVAEALGIEAGVVETPHLDPDVAARELTKVTGDDPGLIKPSLETLAAGGLVARHDGAQLLGIKAQYGVDAAIRHAVDEYKTPAVAH